MAYYANFLGEQQSWKVEVHGVVLQTFKQIGSSFKPARNNMPELQTVLANVSYRRQHGFSFDS
jgi:hypothetical protein